MGLTKEEIDNIKRKRATAKRLMQDSLRYWVGILSIPSIVLMVGTLVASAYYLKSESLAVVSGLVATVTMGLITVLQQMTAPPELPSEMSKALEDLNHTLDKTVDHLITQERQEAEISMDKNHIKIGGNGMKVATSNDKDLVWCNDRPLKKGKK